MNNPYWKNVCTIAERQRAKGIATYGQGIEMNPADAVTRIEHLQEELVDALMYCEWIKDSIKDVAPVVRCKDCTHWYDREEICLKIYSDGAVSPYAWQYRNADDFCSYGERRGYDAAD